jgi:hypothetical protein
MAFRCNMVIVWAGASVLQSNNDDIDFLQLSLKVSVCVHSYVALLIRGLTI